MKPTMNHSRLPSPLYSKGLALIELMIAMVLGLVLIGAATGVMLSNTQSFRTTKSLSQIQDSARLGFELMARDIRQAGSVPCGNDITVQNIITAAQTNAPWYLNWDSGSNGQLIGYAGNTSLAGLTDRIDGTEALTVLYADNVGTSVESINNYAYTFNNANSHFRSGDIAFICNATQGTLFQTDISDGGVMTASQSVNTHTQPGIYEKNSVIGKLRSRTWYIGNNNRAAEGGRSLYLAELTVSSTGVPEVQSIEIASGITDLKLGYRMNDTADFRTATQIGSQWALVNAVQVSLEMLGQDQNVSTDSATDSGRLSRSFSSIVALRNRIL